MSDLTAIFGKPFAWQLAAWRIRLGNQITTAVWDDLWQAQHDRAFTVAGALKAELLADLAAAVDKAITDGGTLESFRKDFRAIVERQGWHGWAGEGTKKGEAWRTKVIYKTNLATSYAAGRLAQLRDGGFDFFVYRHGGSLEPRVQHLAWDGLVLEADHPFWATHAPPNGWGCSCYITGARSREGAKRVGGKPDKELPDGWQTPDPRTGAPKGIDQGWAYAPGETVTDEVAKAVREKLDALPDALAAALAAEIKVKKAGKAKETGMPGIEMQASDMGAAAAGLKAAMDGMMAAMEMKPTGDPDTDFVRAMIPHHEAAVAMAKVELDYGTDPEIRKVAQAVIKAQEAEIAQLKAWLQSRGKS